MKFRKVDLLKEKYKTGKIRSPKEKKVYQYSKKDDLFIREFNNCVEAARQVGLKSPSSIAYCARGNCMHCAGFSWSYELNDSFIPLNNYEKPVIQYDLNDNFIKEWKSATQAAIKLGFNNGAITNCCRGRSRTSFNFKWKYK
jgi:hypothetical protein